MSPLFLLPGMPFPNLSQNLDPKPLGRHLLITPGKFSMSGPLIYSEHTVNFYCTLKLPKHFIVSY